MTTVSVERLVAPRAEPALRHSRTLWGDAARRFRRNKLAVGALVVMLLLVATAVLADVIIAIGLISWIEICRLTRAQLLSLREKEFVMASHALGAGRLHVAVRHMLPNALAPLIVAVTLGVPTAIFTEAGLSFLGLGINDPLPSWG